MDNYSNFTNSNVKFLREKKGLSQGALAEDLSIDQSTLAKWENNTRQITLEWSIKIADYFNVVVGDFISKDLSKIENNYNELDNLLFSKAKELTDEEKRAVLQIINAIHKDIDKELDD